MNDYGNSFDKLSYEISTRSELNGVVLIVRFPEAYLDRKALYTVQADMPSFLLPFRDHIVDGRVECVYQIGDNSKLLYQSGSRTPDSCVELWNEVLQPLMDCEDWFLTPYSFLMDINYLYVGKNRKTVKYIYIPASKPCSDMKDLRDLAAELFKSNPVQDIAMENKIMRALMDDFRPSEFLKTLRAGSEAFEQAVQTAERPRQSISEIEPQPKPQPYEETADRKQEQNLSGNSDLGIGIEINMDDFGRKKSRGVKKKQETSKPEKRSTGLFGGKKQKGIKEIRIGAGADGSDAVQPRKQSGNNGCKTPDQQSDNSFRDSATKLGKTTCGLDRVGSAEIGKAIIPQKIPVILEPGEILSIGRHDRDGKVTSDFEFHEEAYQVSRRHAVIECVDDQTYTITDVNSRFGTFVNMERLQPNMPVTLKKDDRVSFGNAGVDYVWKEFVNEP